MNMCIFSGRLPGIEADWLTEWDLGFEALVPV